MSKLQILLFTQARPTKGSKCSPIPVSLPHSYNISRASQPSCVHPPHWQGRSWILGLESLICSLRDVDLWAGSSFGHAPVTGQREELTYQWQKNPLHGSCPELWSWNGPSKLSQIRARGLGLYTSAVSSHGQGLPQREGITLGKTVLSWGQTPLRDSAKRLWLPSPQRLRKLSASLPKVGSGQNSPASPTELQGIPDFSSDLPGFYELRTQIPSEALVSFGV